MTSRQGDRCQAGGARSPASGWRRAGSGSQAPSLGQTMGTEVSFRDVLSPLQRRRPLQGQ